MAGMIVLTSEKVEKHPTASLIVFLPPIFTGLGFVSVFHVSPPSLDRDHRGGLYIGILGQAEHLDAKMDDIRGPTLKRAWVADTSPTYL
jgi:hypothetical protein